MARRRTKPKRRRSRAFSILNAAETYLYASTLSYGALGGSPWAVITGEDDIPASATNVNSIYAQAAQGGYGPDSWASPISLRELINNPNASLAAMQGNVARNLVPMIIQSTMIGVSFKLGKRLLRKPISATNRGLKMALGAGVKL